MTLAEWTKEDTRMRHQLHCAKMILASTKDAKQKHESNRLIKQYTNFVLPAHLKRKPVR